MSNNCVLDTSFICSLLDPDDVNHSMALSIFEVLPNDVKFWLPETVRLELSLFKIQSEIFGVVDFQKFLDDLHVQTMQIDSGFIESFRMFVWKTKFKIKVIDYTVLYTSFLHGAELLTFDKKLKRFAESLN